jgi:hypothetical protein
MSTSVSLQISRSSSRRHSSSPAAAAAARPSPRVEVRALGERRARLAETAEHSQRLRSV